MEAVKVAVLLSLLAAIGAVPTPRLNGFTLEDFLYGRFSAVGFNGSWISDTEFYYRSADGGLNIYNVASEEVTVVAGTEILSPLGGSSFQLSPDRKFLLYRFNSVQIWRYSSFARYSIYDLDGKQVIPLQPQTANPQVQLRYARWSQSNSLIYVYGNDIYIRASPTAPSDTRLTNDGNAETIFNGVPDWVYEEEVLGSNNAMWTSGNRMVFASFDDRLVDQFDYSTYGAPSSMMNQYPKTTSIRYPKAGAPNPTVTLRVADLSAGTVSPQVLSPPAELATQDHYFYTVDWPKTDEIFVVWMNRKQNVAYFSFCNAGTSACQTEKTISEANGWVDLDVLPYFSSSGSQYLMVSSVSQGGAGNYPHLVLHDRASKVDTPLTSGRWVVTNILAWDETGRSAYVEGTTVDDPSARHVYRVNTASSSATDFVCVTCGALNVDQHECLSNSGRFSPGLTYWVHGCNGPDVPRTVIKEVATGREVFLVSDNSDLSQRLADMALPLPFNLQVPVAGGFNAQVRLLLPPSFDFSSTTKYPLLVYVYGGPKSQQISNRYSINWGTHLASSRNVIYALIDGRGSGYKGDDMMFQIYRRMGSVEIEDQIAVTKYLVDNLGFIDAERTAIWGWSYGGYAAASTLARDTENVFKCAMSVAPVTNWIYYDSIYTERYMGLPTADDNQLAYNDSDVCRLAENFRGKRFYLLHGTGDDNVHYQQSMMLGRSLEALDILFRQQSYPDENHSIGNLNRHLYHSLSTFLMTDCFGLENEVWG